MHTPNVFLFMHLKFLKSPYPPEIPIDFSLFCFFCCYSFFFPSLYSEYRKGLLFLAIVNIIWVSASYIVKSTLSHGMGAFFFSYICNSLFILYLPIYWLGQNSSLCRFVLSTFSLPLLLFINLFIFSSSLYRF